MKIWIHRYELKSRRSEIPSRQGALVKVEWVLGQYGYSDLHPWPEFGEMPLEDHLKSLAELKMTPLAENSLEFNYRDREYRSLKRNAFLGLILPRSHYLEQDILTLEAPRLTELSRMGFTHIKVKMGKRLSEENAALIQLACASSLQWRLDMNGRLSADEFEKWWADLDPAVQRRIDFVEDPIASGELVAHGPWANDWKQIAQAHIRIVKPARDLAEELAQYDRVIFTHSLEHPLGRAASAWSAARFYAAHPKKKEVCGLSAPENYESDDFSREWDSSGPRLKPTSGTGFGFDQLLAELKWERLL